MTSDEFAAWLAFMRSTRNWRATDCAKELNVHGNQIIRWRRNGAPHYIGLACSAICQGLPAWKPPQT